MVVGALLFGAVSEVSAATDRDIPARTVLFELEPVAGRAQYDVEVISRTEHWPKANQFRIETETLRLRLTPGRYEVRTRSIDTEGKRGVWSVWKSFAVAFRDLKGVFPSHGSVLEPVGSDNERIILEWSRVPGARMYYVELRDHNDKVLLKRRMHNHWVPVEVKVNAKYRWGVIPANSMAEINERQKDFPWKHFRISPPPPMTRGVVFELEPIPGAKAYEFEYVRVLSKREVSNPSIYSNKESLFRMRLGPGTYELRARGVLPDETRTDWSPGQSFNISHFPIVGEGPAPGEEVESTDIDTPVRLTWKSQPNTRIYHVWIYHKNGKLAKKLESATNEVTVILEEDSEYSWFVLPILNGENDRRIASQEPMAERPTFKTSTYIRLELSPSEEPSQWYGWSRFITSQISYASDNYDENTRTTQAISGGQAELALGHWGRRNNFGFLLNGNLSGYTDEQGTHFLKGGGLSLGYRHKLESGGRLRYWLGAGYEEIPEILGNSFDATYSIQNLTALGPQAQISYHGTLNEKWGYHALGKLFYGLNRSPTNLGADLSSFYSYQLGLYGTYRFHPKYVGMAGYTYLVQHAGYDSIDTPGQTNTVHFGGHYLSFFLEFALADPKK